MADAAADALVVGALDRMFEAEQNLPLDVSELTVSELYARHLERAVRKRRSLARGGWSVDGDYDDTRTSSSLNLVVLHDATLRISSCMSA